MHHHEKTAFLKFFITYFVSVALLILAAGFFYYIQMKNHILKAEEFSLIEYARHVKLHLNMNEYRNGIYTYKFVTRPKKHIDIRNFTIADRYFMKYMPTKKPYYYLQILKKKDAFNKNLFELKIKIWTLQFLLLLVFAFISYKLANNALKPLQESISTLDKFAKDLIHDLNTPVTSIKLNMKLLEKKEECADNAALQRVKKSVETISELHENLTILLQEETFQLEQVNLCKITQEILQTQQQIYPNIRFTQECSNFTAKLNAHAIKQILQNIISNACKYNTQNGYVKIYTTKNSLSIQNSGPKILNPEKIFERSYSSDKRSSGIGLDIVNRLARAMNIEIKVESDDESNTFILKFLS
ncbi:HAMP domain-containing sensor histidine kinase [Sulfurimonas sp.]|uniref:sensor histidine kinase n=1 Tax=Sulfurimonas sp. TaxID=2022749 RepID=UPI002622E74F|nr:HAMP domain-containing sensor histidine kinase [Sulfurimonas sp.]